MSSNPVMPEYTKSLLNALLTGTVKATLVDLAQYTFNAAHAFISDVPAGARVATATLTGKSIIGGTVFDAADTVFPGAAGNSAEALVLWLVGTTDADSRYVAFWDTGVGGLPVTPNGTDITVQWPADGILEI